MKLLVLQHVPHEHPGHIATYAKERSITLDIVELWKPYSMREIKGYQGLIILGGPMGVYEDFASKTDEVKIIQQAVERIPVLGICLGSQLLAYALGAKVHPNMQNGRKVKEVGYYAVDLTEKGKNDRALKGFSSPIKALQWHGDAFELPQETSLLATSPLCTSQAFSYKNAYGFLFHFEFTPDMVLKQIEIDKEWIHQDNQADEQVILKEAQENTELMKKQCYQLLDNLLSIS